MSKRTAGVRVIDKWGRCYLLTQTLKDDLAAKIDAAIRREKAKAWDECYVRICESDLCVAADLKVPREANPYRGKAKR